MEPADDPSLSPPAEPTEPAEDAAPVQPAAPRPPRGPSVASMVVCVLVVLLGSLHTPLVLTVNNQIGSALSLQNLPAAYLKESTPHSTKLFAMSKAAEAAGISHRAEILTAAVLESFQVFVMPLFNVGLDDFRLAAARPNLATGQVPLERMRFQAWTQS